MGGSEVQLLKDKLKYGQYLVLYFDLMGVKGELFKDIERHCSSVEIAQLKRIDESMSVVSGFVAAMRNLRRTYHENAGAVFDAMAEGVSVPTINRDRERFVLDCKNLEMGIQQGSDTVWVYVRDDDTLAVACVVWDLLLDLALAIVNGLRHDVAIRGCLVRGTAWQPYAGCLFGPVFNEADDFEKKVAEYPRIVVSDCFKCFCERMLNRMSPGIANEDDSLVPYAMIRRDADDISIFDFANPKCNRAWDCFMKRQYPEDKLSFRDLFQVAVDRVEANRERFQAAGEEKLHSKYRKLEDYLKARITAGN